MNKISVEELREIYRCIILDSNYPQCKGCHMGKRKCIVVHELHCYCPCIYCVVKTTCTQYCQKYLTEVTNVTILSNGKYKMLSSTPDGYAIEINGVRTNKKGDTVPVTFVIDTRLKHILAKRGLEF
jgi:hypothetical protein